jgi:PilZ domain
VTDDRRRAPRIQILGQMNGRAVALDVPVTVTEISLGGMGILTDTEFEVGSEHEFQLTLGDNSLVHLKGRVAHSRRVSDIAPRFLSGIQFIGDSDHDAA